MKINTVFLIISILLVSLIGYGFYYGNSAEPYVWVLTIGTGISLLLPLICILAVKFDEGQTANIKVVSSIFFVIMLIVSLVFSFIKFSLAPYIIITGILLLVYILIIYSIWKSLK